MKTPLGVYSNIKSKRAIVAVAILLLLGTLTSYYAIFFTQNAQGLVGDVQSSEGAGVPRYTTEESKSWYFSTVSEDGARLAAIQGTYVYTSSDSGATWREDTSLDITEVTGLVGSDDGMTLLLTTSGPSGKLLVSKDGGDTWTQKGDATGWSNASVSADGTRAAVTQFSGYVYTSVDGGETWIQRDNSNTADGGYQQYHWEGLDLSADGQQIVAIAGHYIVKSLDFGATWTQVVTVEKAQELTGYYRQLAVSDTGRVYIISDDSYEQTDAAARIVKGVTFTLDDPLETWDQITNIENTWMPAYQKITISADGSSLFIPTIELTNNTFIYNLYETTDAGETWSIADSPDEDVENWSGTSLSSDKQHQVRIGFTSHIYTSNDFGQTWQKRTVVVSTPFTNIHEWTSLGASFDGKYMAATVYEMRGDVYGGHIYTSADSGSTWIEHTNTPYGVWSAVTVSEDGERLFALYQNEHVYTSNDGGDTWSIIKTLNDPLGVNVTASSDGKHLVIVSFGGPIYVSHDYGVSWAEKETGSQRMWYGLTSSADGKRVVANARTQGIYVSDDYGETWTVQADTEDTNFLYIKSSADGMTLIGAFQYGYPGISTDGGATWVSTEDVLEFGYWMVDVTASANMLVAADQGSQKVFTSTDNGVSWIQQQDFESVAWTGLQTNTDGSRIVALGRYSSIHIVDRELPVIAVDDVPLVGGRQMMKSQPTFTGTAPIDGEVTVSLSSDPLACQTVADANGNWSCTMTKTVPQGDNEVSAVMARANKSEEFKVGPYDVTVTDGGSLPDVDIPEIITETPPRGQGDAAAGVQQSDLRVTTTRISLNGDTSTETIGPDTEESETRNEVTVVDDQDVRENNVSEETRSIQIFPIIAGVVGVIVLIVAGISLYLRTRRA